MSVNRHQASPRGRRVERVGQTSERGVSLAQGVDGVDQLARRTREAIELPDDQRVALMDRFHRFEQGWSIEAAPETCSVKIFFASGFGQRLPVARGSDRQ